MILNKETEDHWTNMQPKQRGHKNVVQKHIQYMYSNIIVKIIVETKYVPRQVCLKEWL